MKGILKILGLAVVIFTTSGCDKASVNSDRPSNLTKFNGTWEVKGQTQVASPDEVSECGYGIGSGILKISGTTVDGEFTDNSGFSYVLEGTIDESGKMVGAFTYVGYDAATFDGKLSIHKGEGVWKDIYDCPGSWQVKKTDQTTKQEFKSKS